MLPSVRADDLLFQHNKNAKSNIKTKMVLLSYGNSAVWTKITIIVMKTTRHKSYKQSYFIDNAHELTNSCGYKLQSLRPQKKIPLHPKRLLFPAISKGYHGHGFWKQVQIG